MSRDRFDDILMQKLSHESMEPPHSVWSKLEKELAALDAIAIDSSAQEGAKRIRLNSKRAKLWRYAVAASLLLTASIIGLQYSLRQGITDQTAGPMTNTTTEQVRPKQNAIKESIAVVAQSDNRLSTTAKANVRVNGMRVGRAATSQPTESIQATLPTKTVASSQVQSTQVATQTEPQATSTPDTATSSKATATKPQSTDNKKVTEQKQIVNWNKLLAEQTKKEKKSLSTSLYASNFGGGANSQNIEAVNRLAYSNMIINEDIKDLGSQDSGLSTHNTSRQTTDQKLKHKMPFSFGLSLGIGLTDRLSLETGVTYTKLNSQSESSGISKYKLDQDLHYIGIPVSLICNIVDGGHARLYASAGVTVEKCISATRKIETTGENGIVSRQSNRMNVNGIQTSVGAAIGGEWKINKLLGLYVEPGVGYYFENSSQPESYRSENPLNFTIKAGLRININ